MILLIFVAAMAMAQQEGTGALKSTYLLGPDDQVVIRGMDVEELPKEPIRVDPRGNINLPLVGRLKAAGLTLEQLEEAISERLRKYLMDPQIAVSMTEMRSQPVSGRRHAASRPAHPPPPMIRRMSSRVTSMKACDRA